MPAHLRTLTLAALLIASFSTQAQMQAQPLNWTLEGTAFNNVLIYDDEGPAQRPGLVMVSNWYGVNDAAIEKARQIAGKDYVILLVDMYGAGLRPSNDEQAGAAAKALYADRSIMRKRINFAHQQLKAQTSPVPLDASKLAAIGFCFGGSAVLDLARSGADLDAVVSFHARLNTDDPALAKQIKARVLALNGAEDQAVNGEQRLAFQQEMREGGVDWMSIDLGGAVHCFSETDRIGKTGNCRFDDKANRRAFAIMQQWLSEAFSH